MVKVKTIGTQDELDDIRKRIEQLRSQMLGIARRIGRLELREIGIVADRDRKGGAKAVAKGKGKGSR